jgi:hypothetical protein
LTESAFFIAEVTVWAVVPVISVNPPAEAGTATWPGAEVAGAPEVPTAAAISEATADACAPVNEVAGLGLAAAELAAAATAVEGVPELDVPATSATATTAPTTTTAPTDMPTIRPVRFFGAGTGNCPSTGYGCEPGKG